MRVLVDTDTLLATYTTKKAPLISGAFLVSIKDTVLGKDYDLSVTYTGHSTMRKVNKENRNIDTATDILSFPIELGKHGVGEIYICMEKVISKAKKFETTPKKYLEYVLLHGMVHLLGYDHGKKMDAVEKKYCEKLHINYPYRYTE